ncbi:MAG TPA: DinB family protein [Candidatus Angelobacter sp.]
MDAQTFKQEVNDCRRLAQQLVDGLSSDQFVLRANPAKWSIAECIAHLNRTAKVVQKITLQGIARAKEKNIRGDGPFRLGARGRMLIWVAEPPPKFRMPAPRSVVPPLVIEQPEKLIPDFMHAQDEWERLLQEAEGLDLARVTLGPLFSPFRCQMSGGLMWMMAHQRRHLWQAENVKRQILSAAAMVSA